ncbi:unnamed protein product, partial [Clonostachys solani]
AAALEAGESQSLPRAKFDACREANAVISCGIGDARYGLELERGLLTLRHKLRYFLLLYNPAHLKLKKIEELDLKFARELTGGVYYSDRYEASDGEGGTAIDTTRYTKSQIPRLACVAGSYTMQFHAEAAYVITNLILWRLTVTDVFENEFPAVTLYHILVDTAAMFLSSNPTSLNGIKLTENLFGNILSDQL